MPRIRLIQVMKSSTANLTIDYDNPHFVKTLYTHAMHSIDTDHPPFVEPVYTHVRHLIDSGEPCPITESHPFRRRQDHYCHMVARSSAANPAIYYGGHRRPCCDVETHNRLRRSAVREKLYTQVKTARRRDASSLSHSSSGPRSARGEAYLGHKAHMTPQLT